MTGDALALKMYDSLIREERAFCSCIQNGHTQPRKKQQWAINCEEHYLEE